MNLARLRFLALMEQVERGGVATLVVAHKDRLGRFGFEYFGHVAARNGCEVLVANQESLSPEEEMVLDVLAVVRTFSCRLYGLRRCEKVLRGELTGGASCS